MEPDLDQDNRDLEHAPLSGSSSQDGETVDVEIYRYAGTQDPWRLVVVDLSSGRPTAWAETFATDQEAYEAFTAMVEAHGIATFVGVVSPRAALTPCEALTEHLKAKGYLK